MSIFSKIGLKRLGSSTFNMSYDRKFSMNFGDLVPIHCQEVIPGDTISVNPQHMTRLAPMIAPVMHEVNCFIHYFFVPYRIIWNNWEPFITGGSTGLKEKLMPTVSKLPVKKSSLADYLGLPLTEGQFAVGSDGVLENPVSLLPFLAYQKIYDEYYRDQNLEPSFFTDEEDEPVKLFNDGNTVYGEGEGSHHPFVNIFTIRQRAWHHDYFTSALPFAQKGAAVKIPITGEVQFDPDGRTAIRDLDGELGPTGQWRLETGFDSFMHQETAGTGSSRPVNLDNSANLRVENADGTISDLRKAISLQKWLEKNARAGSRYVESIFAHFGEKNPDYRLQRPEFLGGNKTPIMISEVLQQSSTDATSPQGNMSGHGIAIGKSGGFKKHFTEHGYIIGLMSTIPKTSYSQGIPKHFSKTDKFDYFWSEFEHIGEQEIKNKEIFAKSVFTGIDQYDSEGTFGYIPRYSEYKYSPSTVHGDFKENLAFWHLGRIFDPKNPPKLNQEFIHCDKRALQRIFAVEDNSDKFWVHLYQDIKARRKMSYFGDPGRL
ncbi:hypothetical protein CMT37_16995 [Elizabethkingia anophelis]|nr:hypothetical protein [Elizabethkingia anophelis]